MNDTIERTSYAIDNPIYCDNNDCTLVIDLFAVYEPVNELWFCANLVAAVELPWDQDNDDKTVTVPTSLTKLGEVFYDNNPIGVVCKNNSSDTIFVAFRGTSTAEEWKQNFDFATEPDECTAHTDCEYAIGKVHSGFSDIYMDIRSQIIGLVPTTATEIIVAGHSLGGALSLLYVQDDSAFGPNNSNRRANMYGCPRVGDYQFTRSLDPYVGKYVINVLDAVPVIPTSTVPNYGSGSKEDVSFYDGPLADQVVHFSDNRWSLYQTHRITAYLDFLKTYN